MNKHKHVYEILIETSPEKLWQALTDPQMTKQYFYGTEVVSDWNVGGEIRYVGHDGNEMLYCEILEIDEPSSSDSWGTIWARDKQFFGQEFREYVDSLLSSE